MHFFEWFSCVFGSGILLACASCGGAAPLTGDRLPGGITVHPVRHATLVLGWKGRTVYVDPVGELKQFAGLPKPDLILLTHEHRDHFELPVLQALASPETLLAAPAAVAAQLPEDLKKRATVLANGESKTLCGILVEAVPAYNTTAEHLKFHPKGAGNGYVLTLGDKRVYISGDTEDIPEMRALKAIDAAFLCVNQPYTMTVEEAASATRAFRPKIVYPYHYKGANLPASDLEQYRKLVGADLGIEVRLRDWYP